MCRYLQYPVKTHWACIGCRYTAKAPRFAGVPCPRCGDQMADLGRDFKAPRHGDIAQWRKVALLLENGIVFDSCGCSGPGKRPKTLAEAKAELVSTRKRRRDEPDALRRFARRRRGNRITPART